jgi:hypothetical protein
MDSSHKRRHHARQNRPSDTRLLAGAVFVIVGRLVLVIASGFGLTYVTFQSGLNPLRILLGFAIAVLILVVAAYLVREFRWSVEMPVFGLAGGTLILGAALIWLYLHREPHYLTLYEASILAICFCGFGLSLFWLRRGRRKRT